jgi:hypothetical protein
MPSKRDVGEGADSYTEVFKHFSGIPEHLDAATRLLADQGRDAGEGTKLGDIYANAIIGIIDAHARPGARITWLATVKGEPGVKVPVWIRQEIAEELENFCRQVHQSQSAVVVTALERYLRRLS